MATAIFCKSSVTYGYTHRLVGLGPGDSSMTSFAGDSMSLNWRASNPSDQIRVMTAVLEPGTYVLMDFGLGVLGLVARRRRAA